MEQDRKKKKKKKRNKTRKITFYADLGRVS